MSLNECSIISDWESFKNYPWPDPAAADYSIFDDAKPILIDKMKIILRAPNGVLANLMYFIGYDNLCYMIYDDPKLIQAISDAVGERLLEYYKLCIPNENIGALMYNDDWGFHTGPLFPPDFFQKYIFPWVRKFTEVAHKNGKPAMIHSCGNLGIIMDSIIDDLKFDGKHSFEDKIMPIETAYKTYSNRIALLGGIDMDFVCRASKEEIYNRSRNMLKLGKTGYALGTGNSVPYFVPMENFFAMISAAGL